MRPTTALAFVLAALAAAGCGERRPPCNDDADCGDGEACLVGQCTLCVDCRADGDPRAFLPADDKGANAPDGIDGDIGDDGDQDAEPVDDAAWWDDAWPYRALLVVDGADLAEDLIDFPALVLLDGTFPYVDVADDASDLRFVGDDGDVLPHEVEAWSPGYTSALWVRVPRVPAGSVARVRLYFGAAAVPDVADAPAVWDDGFEAVHHFGDDLQDSTGRGIDGDADGTSRVMGEVGPARAFDGAGSIDLGVERDLLRATTAATISLRANLTPGVTEPQVLVGVGVNGGGAPTGVSRATIEIAPSGGLRAGGRALDDDTLQSALSSTPVPRDGWHHVAATIDYAAGVVRVYVDGVEQATEGEIAFGAAVTADTTSSSSRIGADDDGAPYLVDGVLDEVRISRVARSASWLRAEARAGGLVSVGTVQSR